MECLAAFQSAISAKMTTNKTYSNYGFIDADPGRAMDGLFESVLMAFKGGAEDRPIRRRFP